MSAAAKPDLSGPLDNSDGKFQSSRALTREYDSWIKRFQAFSGPTCIAKARRALPSAFLTQMVVPMALAMQCTRDKDLREQGTRLLWNSPMPGLTSPATTPPCSGPLRRRTNRAPSS